VCVCVLVCVCVCLSASAVASCVCVSAAACSMIACVHVYICALPKPQAIDGGGQKGNARSLISKVLELYLSCSEVLIPSEKLARLETV
jgi:hypothetical protein